MIATHLLTHTLFVGLMWILTNQRECVEKCVLEGVLLPYFYDRKAIGLTTTGLNILKLYIRVQLSHD